MAKVESNSAYLEGGIIPIGGAEIDITTYGRVD
jgi:hypothetical protein